uniref:Cilia- and flagella-associated protein 61 N-terminal domain-containing protein n=1 Tax=Dendroctonus ponderosae TaxID=77166 RepID=A0AAR5PBY9_DENPD
MEKVKTYEVDPRLTYVDMMEKLSKSMISTRSRTAHVPKFCGRGNAFSIEVAATHPDHEIGLYHVLEAVFECYPDRDYAVISTPTSCRSEQWMERFNRVAPRPASNHAYDLFVCHRSSLLGELECQVAGREHMAEVYTLLSTIPTRAIVLSHFEIFMEFENSPYQCFVFLCEGHVVGTAVVSEEYNVEYIDAQYDIASWVPLSCYRSGSYGLIESLILSPIFHNSGRFFKRELHRLSDFQVLFYKQRAYDKGASRERPIPNLLHWLQPVLPRRMPEYDLKMFAEEGYHVSDALIRRDHYALYMSTVSQSSMQRYSINTRIVVVGCSNTAYAFLEALLIRQHNPHYMVGGACPPPVTVPVTPPWLQINFNNVVLVCPDGVHSKLPKKIKELFSVQKNFMTERYMEMISLKTYIGVVTGNLTQINRYFLVGSQPDVFSLTSASQ